MMLVMIKVVAANSWKMRNPNNVKVFLADLDDMRERFCATCMDCECEDITT